MPRSPRMGESGALGNRHRYSARQENPSANQISSSIATGAISGLEASFFGRKAQRCRCKDSSSGEVPVRHLDL